ncbi:MAG: glycoside hydrolase family 92 protein, partial [Bacteroidota bacterium]
MKISWFFTILLLISACAPKESIDFSKKVNPFIGTGGHGHTYPGASAPFGMVQLSPDTRVYGWDACSGYHYSDSTILGFSHTHLSGTGAADYGDILFTPRISLSDTLPIKFKHDNEEAWAGYYKVNLKNSVDVELTTTKRVGIHQYSYSTDNAFVAIDLKHGIGPDNPFEMGWKKTGDSEITGYRRSEGWARDQMVHYVAQFSDSFSINNDTDST